MNTHDSVVTTEYPVTESEARNLTDAFALAWIFFNVLAAGLLLLSINTVTVSLAVFSTMLGGIWWILCHVRRQRR